MEFSMKWSFQLLTVFARGFTLNVWLGSEYAFVMFTSSKKTEKLKSAFKFIKLLIKKYITPNISFYVQSLQ